MGNTGPSPADVIKTLGIAKLSSSTAIRNDAMDLAARTIDDLCGKLADADITVVRESEDARRARLAASDGALEEITRLEREVEAVEQRLRDMTLARDGACNMGERMIDELAAHEDDPDMMDGHRVMLAGFRRVGEPAPSAAVEHAAAIEDLVVREQYAKTLRLKPTDFKVVNGGIETIVDIEPGTYGTVVLERADGGEPVTVPIEPLVAVQQGDNVRLLGSDVIGAWLEQERRRL